MFTSLTAQFADVLSEIAANGFNDCFNFIQTGTPTT